MPENTPVSETTACATDIQPTAGDPPRPPFDGWESFVAYERTRVHSHRDEAVLRYLYVECGWTTRETADYLGVHHATVSRQLRRHDIETRPSASERARQRGDHVVDTKEEGGDAGDAE